MMEWLRKVDEADFANEQISGASKQETPNVMDTNQKLEASAI
uniref:Uncharacterized protein n=1 Tax=Candidozyma auris TaxID=498019 RepID=A0A0L0P5M0_CANAR